MPALFFHTKWVYEISFEFQLEVLCSVAAKMIMWSHDQFFKQFYLNNNRYVISPFSHFPTKSPPPPKLLNLFQNHVTKLYLILQFSTNLPYWPRIPNMRERVIRNMDLHKFILIFTFTWKFSKINNFSMKHLQNISSKNLVIYKYD